MSDAPAVIAVVDDDAAFGELVLDIVASEGLVGMAVSPRGSVVDRLREVRPALIIMDWRLGEGQEGPTAEPLLRDIADDPELRATPVLVCSADMAALREHVPLLPTELSVTVLEKPFGVEAFIGVVHEALARSGVTR